MDLYQRALLEDFNSRLIEILGAKWTDYEGYLDRYGPINNPDVAAEGFSFWQVYNGIGFLLMEKNIELDRVEHMFGGHGPRENMGSLFFISERISISLKNRTKLYLKIELY